MFEGMSDDEEDFQSVSHAAWSLRRSAWVTRRRRRSSKCPFSACECLLTGEPSGPLQPSGRLSGHAAHIAEPQRGGGASADHAERAGDGSGSRQHSRQQCGHAYNVQPGENRGVWRTDGGNIFPLPNYVCVCTAEPCCSSFSSSRGLWFRETPPIMRLRCLQGPQSVMISSARPCSKLCKPPTCPLCRWGRRLDPEHSIHRGTFTLLYF